MTATIPTVRAAIEQREQRNHELLEALHRDYGSLVYRLAQDDDGLDVGQDVLVLLDELGVDEQRLASDVRIVRQVPALREAAARLAELSDARGEASAACRRHDREAEARRKELWKAAISADAQASNALRSSDRLRSFEAARPLLFASPAPQADKDARARAAALASAEQIDLSAAYRKLFRLAGEPDAKPPAKARRRKADAP